MTQFPEAVRAWPTEAFSRILKKEIESLHVTDLPLQAAASQGGYVADTDITAMVLTKGEQGNCVIADVGVFFTEIVGGCSCGDEPEAINTYCRLRIHIDKVTAEAKIQVTPD